MEEIFKALSSRENIDLFEKILSLKKVAAKDLGSNLTIMPLNRRLNILMDAGLIERVPVRDNDNYIKLENRITNLGLIVKDMMNYFDKKMYSPKKRIKLKGKLMDISGGKQSG